MKLSITNSQNNLSKSQFNPETDLVLSTHPLKSSALDGILETLEIISQNPHAFSGQRKARNQRQTLCTEQAEMGNSSSASQNRNFHVAEIKNVVENNTSQKNLKHKTSVEDRISDQNLHLDAETQPDSESKCLIPYQKWKIDDPSLIEISNNNSITEVHLDELFKNADTHLITLTLIYFSKIVGMEGFSSSERDELLILALSKILATKSDCQFSNISMENNLCETLSLCPYRLKSLKDEVLGNADFDKEVKQEVLERIVSILI